MTQLEKKREFIRLRAEGESYSKIAETLGISKSTCTAWNQELEEEIATLKSEELKALYETYSMTRKARIRALGEILNRIDHELDKANLSEVPVEKLLDYKLKYLEALKDEHIEPVEQIDIRTTEDVLGAFSDLINRVRQGEVSDRQAQREAYTLTSLLKAYDQMEVAKKLDLLEAIIGGR